MLSICNIFLSGLQQQGIFRVPGSQVEVNDIKNSFERGESCYPVAFDSLESETVPYPIECHHWMLICDYSSGEDPLIDDHNEHDINSVAGVLKLYFRGLENSLFPKERFLDFISTISESPSIQSRSSCVCVCVCESLILYMCANKTAKTEKQSFLDSQLMRSREQSTHMEPIGTPVAPGVILSREPVERKRSDKWTGEAVRQDGASLKMQDNLTA